MVPSSVDRRREWKMTLLMLRFNPIPMASLEGQGGREEEKRGGRRRKRRRR